MRVQLAGTVQTHFGGYAPDVETATTSLNLQSCLREAALLDECGFDALYIAERHGRSECVAPQPLQLLAAIAAITQRIRLGTYVALPLLHHPIDMAEQFAQLDAMSGGRAIAGLGAGFHPDYFRLFGTDTSKRLTRLEQVVEILRTAWAGEEVGVDFDGRRLEGPVWPRPTNGVIPIVIGAQFPRSIAMAGRIGDGWAVAFGFDKATWDQHVDRYLQACSDAGRTPSVALSRHCWVADSQEEAEAFYAPMWLEEQRYYFDRGQLLHRDFQSTTDFTLANARPNLVLGTPQECAEQIVRLIRDWQVDVVKLACRVPKGPEPARAMTNWKRIGAEVLPLVRAELGIPEPERVAP